MPRDRKFAVRFRIQTAGRFLHFTTWPPLTTHEAALVLGTSAAGIRRLIHRGELSAQRTRSQYLLDQADVNAQAK